MKSALKYNLLLLAFITISGCRQNKKKLPSLTESYRKTDKLPFGAFIAYQGFTSEFPDYWVNIAERPFTKTWQSMQNQANNTYSLYFLITKNLLLSVDEVNAMVEYVKAGNDLFISADYVDPKLLDATNCSVN
ncbi:MAG TPA: hypothetical protein VFF57_11800, partial [Hanamia sp.]|nr:hypothetical protein [Hanamia sp.]